MDSPMSRSHGKSPEERSPEDSGPPAKRARVALACQRCKVRKQKCNGASPSCSNCARFDVECQYVYPMGWKPGGKKFYITALENRVAELEGYLATTGHTGLDDDHWKQVQKAQEVEAREPPPEFSQAEEVDSLLGAIRDLSLSANGHYIGGTSTITLGRLLWSVIKGQNMSNPGIIGRGCSEEPEEMKPKSISNSALAEIMGPWFSAEGVSTRLYEGYIKHISTRFPVLHTPRILELHRGREHIDNPYDEAILHLVYATGGRFLETTGETGNFFCDHHCEAALAHMDEILELRDTRAVSYLVLLGLYCLRTPKDLGAWTYAGLAMRICIEIGLHRRSKNRKPSLSYELDKRVFWACYYLDREVSVALGRPPAVSDNDIDAELVLDIDEEIDDDVVVIQASKNITNKPRNPPTSLTSFIHHLRLKKIESEIQHLIYRVDRPIKISKPLVQSFIDRLSAWEAALPLESRGNVEDDRYKPFDGIDVYLVPYHRTCRLLLYPTLSESPVNMEFLTLCAQACGGVCEAYKRLHHSMNIGFSPLSLQNVFLAGLTLLYCMWLAPGLPSMSKHHMQLTDCSIMLYVMTERFPSARKYRDVFESIKTSVTEIIVKSQTQPRKRIASFNSDMKEKCRGLESGFDVGVGREQFTFMIGEMTGRSFDFASMSNQMSDEGESSSSKKQAVFDQATQGAAETTFDSGMFDYEPLGEEWSMPLVEGRGMGSEDGDMNEWGTFARLG